MKISIGAKVKNGPWGGGNLFVKNLSEFLESNQHEVIFNLKENNIDLILLTDPRFFSESSTFDHIDAFLYKKFVNSNVTIIHRINECDERKNTNNVNRLILKANRVADHTIFVSNWLKSIYENIGFNTASSVILSGSDTKIFNRKNFSKWNSNEKIKIVTHHWGANWNKGFEVYKKLDNLLNEKKWREIFEFKYIGNLPKDFKFRNTLYLEPLSGQELSNEIKKSNLYITGSINEPSGNHHIEAAQCGLPILFIESGGVTEYCTEYGIKYTLDTLEDCLLEAIKNYEYYYSKMKNYPNNSIDMSKKYEKVFVHEIKKNKKYNNKLGVYRIIFYIFYNLKFNLRKFIFHG